MSDPTNLVQCAEHVLRAFPIREPGVEISGKLLADYFFKRNIPAAQCVVGLRHAVARGWVQMLPEERLRLLETGVAFLYREADPSRRPDHLTPWIKA